MDKKTFENLLGRSVSRNEHQQAIELAAVQTLLDELGIADSATLDVGNDPPDAIVRVFDQTIGVEHTTLIDGRVRKAQDAYAKRKEVPGFQNLTSEQRSLTKPRWNVNEQVAIAKLRETIDAKDTKIENWPQPPEYDERWLLVEFDDSDHLVEWSLVEGWILNAKSSPR